MDRADHDLIQRFRTKDPLLKRLYKEHLELEKQLQKYELYEGYSSAIKLDQQERKKQKLLGVDQMMEILGNYREEN